jgi:hypothetical protein
VIETTNIIALEASYAQASALFCSQHDKCRATGTLALKMQLHDILHAGVA